MAIEDSRLTTPRPPAARARGAGGRRAAAPPRLGAGGRARRDGGLRAPAIAAITRHDPGRLGARPAGPVRGRRRRLLFVAILLVDPDRYRRLQRPIYVGTLGVMLARARRSAPSSHGSKRWINVGFFTLPAVGVREGRLRARARGFPRRPRAADREPARPAATRSGSASLPILLVFVQPDIGTALVYAAALARGAVLRRRALAAPGDPARADRGRLAGACSGCCRRRASTC